MIQYHIHCHDPERYTLHIEVHFTPASHRTTVRMAYWRPGRYEWGNFPRNMRNFTAWQGGNMLHFAKATPHSWHVETPETNLPCMLRYELYAAELTAGNTYVDSELLLINPVNALLYIEGFEQATSTVHLQLPANEDRTWKYATSLKSTRSDDAAVFHAPHLQELLDSPILASQDLLHFRYEYDGVTFHLHVCGAVRGEEGTLIPPFDRLLRDFEGFTKAQIDHFGGFPVPAYHFLFIFTPHRYHHGVEHEKNTVIVLGPAAELHQDVYYKELLGVASHELYHTWNVKALRPKEWLPYTFDKESPSRLAYVAEGITTYMGDWMLWQSGVLNDDWWLDELSVHIQKHLDNEGRNHLSLADAAIDTWIDGYNRQPTPGRKVSIYTEGALLALVMDSWIMRCTNGRKHLAHFMKHFFRRYCHSGYTETQWWHAIQAFAPMPWHRLRADVIDGTGLLEAYFREALDFLGLEIAETPAAHPLEATWGLRLSPSGAGLLVQHVVPHGPAWQAGIPHYSHIVEINGAQALQSFGESLHHPTLTAQKVDVKLRSGFRTRMCTIVPSGATWTWNYTLHVAHQERFESWKQAVSMPKSHTEHG